MLSRVANIPLKKCPLSYLGCPIIKGRAKLIYFEDLLQKFQARLQGWYTKLLSNMGRIVLIQSVLNSMPIHLLTSLNLPKGIISRMNSIMASFLWSGKANTRKRHWCSWKKITMPKEEGGLGFRKFEEVQQAFRMKQVWGLLNGRSLWAKFFVDKYCNKGHLLRSPRLSYSKAYRMLYPWFEEVVNNSLKLVGRGDEVDFWCDNWSQLGPLIHRASSAPLNFPYLSQVLVQGRWDFNRVRQHMDEQLIQDVIALQIELSERGDQLIWQHTTRGNFTIKSAWNLIQSAGQQNVQAS